MEYETKCDYVFYDEEMFDNPQHITDVLELPFVGCKCAALHGRGNDVRHKFILLPV
jgi:hypothetical protein